MKGRLAGVALLLGLLATGITWLSVQPILARLLTPAHPLTSGLRAALPGLVLMDWIVTSLIFFGVMYLVVARPLQLAEGSIDRLGRLELDAPLPAGTSPLFDHVQTALRRTAEALRGERELTRAQVEELRKVNDTLAQAQTELISAERLATVGRLAAGIAHEVGNPLSGILGYLSLIRSRAAGSPKILECIDPIEREVQRIGGIVRGLLDLGRPSTQKPEPVELGPLIESIVRLAASGAEMEAVRVSVEVPPGLVAITSQGPLSQVLLNLLLNAAQAMEGNGQVEVRASREGAEIRVTVEDAGPGIAADVLPRLFEPFFTTKGAGKGTGLGLAVSSHLVSSMNGRLAAENRPSGGARFTVTLPAAGLS